MYPNRWPILSRPNINFEHFESYSQKHTPTFPGYFDICDSQRSSVEIVPQRNGKWGNINEENGNIDSVAANPMVLWVRYEQNSDLGKNQLDYWLAQGKCDLFNRKLYCLYSHHTMIVNMRQTKSLRVMNKAMKIVYLNCISVWMFQWS